jgi:uncharacterized damage-inducible protein DinB
MPAMLQYLRNYLYDCGIMKAILLAVLITLIPASARSQTPPAFAAAFDAVAANLSEAAAAMPADKFGYRPVAEVRSFGQIIAHVTGAHFLYCSQASGTKMPPEVLKQLGALRPYSDVPTEAKARTFDKAELSALLAHSIAFCKGAYEATDAKGWGRLIDNIAHSNEHYGNLVVYMRQNAIVPPSTARSAK